MLFVKIYAKKTPEKRPHSSAFPLYDTIPMCDGQTDGQTDK